MNYKKKLKKHNVHFGKDDIIIGSIRFNPVHYIPNDFCEINEVDIYMDTGQDVFILRILNSDKNMLTFVDGEIVYIIFEKRVLCNAIDELNNCILLLENITIPKKIQKQLSYQL